MVHLAFLFLLALFATNAQADEAKAPGGLPVLISAGIGYSVLPDGILGGPSLSHGVRTVITWGDSGWTSIQDVGFTTGTLAFQPCPRYIGDLSHQITSGGLRLGMSYGLRFAPAFEGIDSSFSVSTGPVLIKPIKGVGGVAVVLPLNYNLATDTFSTGVSFVLVIKMDAD
ncbi:MAG: hypothetical protein V1716_00920 [Candidatus Uhrbacteria bacterium]